MRKETSTTKGINYEPKKNSFENPNQKVILLENKETGNWIKEDMIAGAGYFHDNYCYFKAVMNYKPGQKRL